MFICPSCKNSVIVKQSRIVTETTKEKYYHCKNTSCLMSFKTVEGFEAYIRIPEKAAL